MNKRIILNITGRVQGVGFRPTVYRYATEHGLSGYVKNTPSGVIIEVEGEAEHINRFFEELKNNPPRQARIQDIRSKNITPTGSTGFKITSSQHSGDILVGMPPDLATCEQCRNEIFTPIDRRYRYPFINCTDCGPRFTIIKQLPYDRSRTSMASFEMCEKCAAEYTEPSNRRFDAQPNACPKCGPFVRLITHNGKEIPGDALSTAANLLKKGAVLAVKGLGGYHLACDAANDKAVRLLRERKKRPAKSLAVMFASLDEIRKNCEVSGAEQTELSSFMRPIVILPRRLSSNLSHLISPDTRDIGAFLPYTPLHYLLLSDVSPLVMTSGNLAEEPIVKDENELNRILGTIADYALIHNRAIIRRCDDSVLKLVNGKRLFLRRSRGFVPDHIQLSFDGEPVLACGAELKNTFCITRGSQAFMSQHIGDLTDYTSYRFFCEQIDDMTRLLKITPRIIAHDMHPDYLSTRYALESDIENVVAVQHHHAHIAACMAENQLQEKVIGVALDGTGYSPEGTVWGGEFLVADLKNYRRVAHFKQYRMPGGDEAIRKPSRMALSCLSAEVGCDKDMLGGFLLPDISDEELRIILQIIQKGFHSPLTSSAARLFDAVSAILGICGTISYEGQAAIRAQSLAREGVDSRYEFVIEQNDDCAVLSFGTMIHEILADIKNKEDLEFISAKFHNTVAEAVAEMCVFIRKQEHINKIALSGGVFQNDLLLRLVTDKLLTRSFEVYCHSVVPPNDGGLALGQAAVALAKIST